MSLGDFLSLGSSKKSPRNSADFQHPCRAGHLGHVLKRLEKDGWEGLPKEIARFEKGALAIRKPRGKNKFPHKETPLVSAASRTEAQNRLREN
jgi:hypothetical protein